MQNTLTSTKPREMVLKRRIPTQTQPTDKVLKKRVPSEIQHKAFKQKRRRKRRPDIINNSGRGNQPIIKLVSDKFNWGAFFLSWVWGLNYGKNITLLMIPAFFIPPVALLLSIWFGVKGNTWAWQHTRYKGIQEFHKIQKRWAKLGTFVFVASLSAITYLGYTYMDFIAKFIKSLMY
ncbi:MAG: hypothetical protein IJY61_00960 [Candidatus Gastranaerophilales bacterium]|nr:hypothetical protein [Candidatus Gastranaerophilales bacterium]